MAPTATNLVPGQDRPPGLLALLVARELGFRRVPAGSRPPQGQHLPVPLELGAWAEADFLRHCSAQYANLQQSPRSTIAAAFSADGEAVASTHGDHTVKVTRCATGDPVAVLDGHARTPWVVRFNPARPGILASGSLDHVVAVWEAGTGRQLLAHNFGKPIASVAFHSGGNVMAVASGHKVYTWDYTASPRGTPDVVLRTRKSLRALHFHPLGAPLLLTAEVVERKGTTSADPGATQAPAAPATAFDVLRGGGPIAAQVRALSDMELMLSALHDTNETRGASATPELAAHWLRQLLARRRELAAGGRAGNEAAAAAVRQAHQELPVPNGGPSLVPLLPPTATGDTVDCASGGSSCFDPYWGWEVAGREHSNRDAAGRTRDMDDDMQPNDRPPTGGVPPRHQLPLPAMGSGSNTGATPAAEQPCVVSLVLWPFQVDKPGRPLVGPHALPPRLHLPRTVLCSEMGVSFSQCGRFLAVCVCVEGRVNLPQPPQPSAQREEGQQAGAGASSLAQTVILVARMLPPIESWQLPLAGHPEVHGAASGAQRLLSQAATYFALEAQQRSAAAVAGNGGVAAALAAALAEAHAALAAALRAFEPAAAAAAAVAVADRHYTCAMGLVRRVARHVLEGLAEEPGDDPMDVDTPSAPSAQLGNQPPAALPNPAPALAPAYELRIYSLDGPTFGRVVAASPVAAAHCLTSLQFSPTSRHLLVAYGRRHVRLTSLLLLPPGSNAGGAGAGTAHAVHTVLEVYSFSAPGATSGECCKGRHAAQKALRLVRRLVSQDDEVNVAAWHPHPGGGIAYGTKEGKLRLLRHDRRPPARGCLAVLGDVGSQSGGDRPAPGAAS